MGLAETKHLSFWEFKYPLTWNYALSLNEQEMDLLLQHAPHAGTSSQNSVLLRDFGRSACEAVDSDGCRCCSFTAVLFLISYWCRIHDLCCQSRAKYCLKQATSLVQTSPSFSSVSPNISFILKTVSPRRTGASEKFRLNLGRHFPTPYLAYVSYRNPHTKRNESQWPCNVFCRQRGNAAVNGFAV